MLGRACCLLLIAGLLSCEGGALSGSVDPVPGGSKPVGPLPPFPDTLPVAGNPDGKCGVPAEAAMRPVTNPDHVIGDGTPASCTSEALVKAVAAGGTITFNCGKDPLTIPMAATAEVQNKGPKEVVIDGGGLITLSGQGQRRILLMDTCLERLGWATTTCNLQDFPRLHLQNLSFVDGNAGNDSSARHGGGGALFVFGGSLYIKNCRFFRNKSARTGKDVGGGAVRVRQLNGRSAYVINSTFGGSDALDNVSSNGGAISGLVTSWAIINSVITHNKAVGHGGNHDDGSGNGGSGGAIYMDGKTLNLQICGSKIEANAANEYGSAIFFVSNTRDGTLTVKDSTIKGNKIATDSDGWHAIAPQIAGFEDTRYTATNSVVEY